MKRNTFVVKVGPTEISNYNLPEYCCSERVCDKRATHFLEMEFMGLGWHIILCDEHADKIREALE